MTSQVNPGQWPPEVEHLPVCPHRKLPIPFIAEVGADGTGHFTILDNDRARECLKHRLCAMCGLPMGAEIAFLGDVASLEPDGFWIEPPVHERCAEITAGGLCPFMSRERVPRRPPEDGVAILGLGPDELADVGRSIAKRPSAMAITRTYTTGLVISHGRPPGDGLPGRPDRPGPPVRLGRRRQAGRSAARAAPGGTGGSQPAPPQAAEPPLNARRKIRAAP